MPGSADGPGGDALTVTQDTQGVAGTSEALDKFGAAVAVEDLDGDGNADLVVGAPGEDTDTGRVTIVRGPADGTATSNVPGYGRNKDATASTSRSGPAPDSARRCSCSTSTATVTPI